MPYVLTILGRLFSIIRTHMPACATQADPVLLLAFAFLYTAAHPGLPEHALR